MATMNGRLFIFFVMVYRRLVTAQTSDEAEAEAASSASLPGSDSDSISVSICNQEPVPDDPSSTPEKSGKVHPVMKIVQEKELGKSAIGLAIPIATGTVVFAKDKLGEWEANAVLILVSVGLAATLSGILLKETYPKYAEMVEAVGIVLVSTSFFAIIAFFLPAQLFWVPALGFGLCLFPFAIAVWQLPPT